MNRRWICNDIWMDIFPHFDRPQLGLKLALISPRFNSLVDAHFDGKSELTIWRDIEITKGIGAKPILSVQMEDKYLDFPLPDRPLPNKIHFHFLQIEYIDHSVIAFLRSNRQIFDKKGTFLQLWIPCSNPTDDEQQQPIWNIVVREIWPIFAPNIRHLGFTDGHDLDKLRHLISPTILTDLNQLNSIGSFDLLPEAIGDDFDGPNSTISAAQALSKWLHSPRKDGQPKRLRCCKKLNEQWILEWINNFKKQFLRATISSVSYQIHFSVHPPSMPMVQPFEFVVNEWTNEKLTLTKAKENVWDNNCWIKKRCKIIEETEAAVQQQKNDANWDNFNIMYFWLSSVTNSIGPLSPPPTAEDDEAGQSSEKEGQSSEKEGQSSEKAGQSSEKDGQSSEKEGQSSEKEGQSSKKEGQSSEKGQSSAADNDE